MDVNKITDGQTYNVRKATIKPPSSGKNPNDMTVFEMIQYRSEIAEDAQKIEGMVNGFTEKHVKNGKVDILVQNGDNGVAIVSGEKIRLSELAAQGEALAEYALLLRDYDENKDGYIEEHEMYTSTTEKVVESGTSVLGSTIGGAATGAAVTAWLGPGAIVGAKVGAVVGFIGGLIYETPSTVKWVATDKYHTPDFIR